MAVSAQAANDAWSTAPASANFSGINWTTGSTIPGAATGTIASGDSAYFGTSSITTLNDDEAAGFAIAGFTFNAGASAFTIGGNSIALSTGVSNLSTNTQTINNALTGGAATALVTTAGGGNIVLGGALTLGAVSITGGGSVTMNGSGSTGQINLAQTAGSAETLNFAPTGTIALGGSDFLIGAGAGSSGVVNETAGTVTQGAGNQFVLGSGSTTAYASYVMSDGNVSIGTLRAGGTGGSAEGNSYFLLTGGTVTGQGNSIINRNSSGTNVLYINGATAAYNTATSFYAGYAGSGTGVITIGAGTAKAGTSVLLGSGGFTGTGILNLNGGTLTTPAVTGQAGTDIVNFNGGTLQASAASATFISGVTNANVFAGGGTIDSNGNNITIGQNLLAAAGNGVTTIPVNGGGTGYIGSPVVQITGGGGTGATAVANLTGGVVTSITITSPGTGYTSAPTVALVGGGSTTAATATTATIAANAADGGITKVGAGILTLTGANTYSGGTRINGGTLLAGNTGSSLTSSATGTGTVAVGNAAGTFTGILGGTGSVLGAITVNPGSTITGGTVGTVGTLTAQSNLTLAGTAGSAANFTVDITGSTADRLAISGILSLSNASITFNGTPTASSYTLATYSSETGGAFTGTVPAGYQLRYNANELDLVAVPEPSTWAGVAFFGGLLGLALRQRRSRTAVSARLALSRPF